MRPFVQAGAISQLPCCSSVTVAQSVRALAEVQQGQTWQQAGMAARPRALIISASIWHHPDLCDHTYLPATAVHTLVCVWVQTSASASASMFASMLQADALQAGRKPAAMRRAPEIISGMGHGKAVDWWSVGILLYEMLCGMPPFKAKGRKQLQAQILSAKLKLPRAPCRPLAHASHIQRMCKGAWRPNPLLAEA